MGSLGKLQLHIRKCGGKTDDGNIATLMGEAARSGWGLLASAAALPHKFGGSELGLTCFASPVVVSFICTRFLSLSLQLCSSSTKGAPPLASKEQNYSIGNSKICLLLSCVTATASDFWTQKNGTGLKQQHEVLAGSQG